MDGKLKKNIINYEISRRNFEISTATTPLHEERSGADNIVKSKKNSRDILCHLSKPVLIIAPTILCNRIQHGRTVHVSKQGRGKGRFLYILCRNTFSSLPHFTIFFHFPYVPDIFPEAQFSPNFLIEIPFSVHTQKQIFPGESLKCFHPNSFSSI